MSLRWQTLTLLLFFVVAWGGCSGESQREAPQRVPTAGKGSAGRGGSTAGVAGSKGGKGTGGTSTESGAAGVDSDGGQAPIVTGGFAGVMVTAGQGGSVVVPGVGGAAGLAGGGSAGTTATGGTGGTGGSGPPFAWKCLASSYGDGVCNCGCGVADPDCKKDDIDHCKVCDAIGSCSGAACPDRIDPDDTTRCLPLPNGWTCAATTYADGKTCNCGCGAHDPDCDGEGADACDSCQAQGSCGHAPCPASIDADDNTKCTIAHGWYCPDYNYGDGFCDCGCGVVDVDCPDAKATSCEFCLSTSCAPYDCSDLLDPDDNSFCTQPPYTWKCPARLYNDGTRCDCGCGVPDPDCHNGDLSACDNCNAQGSCSAQACPGIIDPDVIWSCAMPEPPEAWTCASFYYGDGYCDCGCGVPDVDCRGTDVGSCDRCEGCGGWNCPGRVDPSDNSQCQPPPAGWTCSGDLYGEGYTCDCGCGIQDPDCVTADIGYCGECPLEGCAVGHCERIDEHDTTQCTVNVPSTWACDRTYFGDGVCDCGCSAHDIDCSNATKAVCDICNSAGSCATSCSQIATSDNSTCTP